MLIKISAPGQPENLDFSQFTGNSTGEIDDCRVVGNVPGVEPDAWFVVDNVENSDSSAVVAPRQVHFLSGETAWRSDKFLSPGRLRFLKQFFSVNTPFINRHGRWNSVPAFLPWMINANHGEIFTSHVRDLEYLKHMQPPRKTKLLSVFCSSKTWQPGHRDRLRFTEKLATYFGGDLTWFGEGINPVGEKWEGLADFTHTIVLENRSDPLMLTEKILDPFLTFTSPIYWGAPDIGRFLPVPSASRIDINDFSASLKVIRSSIETTDTSERIERLSDGRELVLGKLNFLRRICQIAKHHEGKSNRQRKRLIEVNPTTAYP